MRYFFELVDGHGARRTYYGHSERHVKQIRSNVLQRLQARGTTIITVSRISQVSGVKLPLIKVNTKCPEICRERD